MSRHTRTYSTAQVILASDGRVWVEDFSYTGISEPLEIKACMGNHARPFADMHEASIWLWEQGAVIERLTVWMMDDETTFASPQERTPEPVPLDPFHGAPGVKK